MVSRRFGSFGRKSSSRSRGWAAGAAIIVKSTMPLRKGNSLPADNAPPARL